jgi:anaerobic magnesium-protoporphyrin IX monomethyl ester cyclase
MIKKKILLITPPYHSGVIEAAGRWAPIGLIYIAGHLKKAGYDVILYDSMSLFDDYSEVEAKIESINPDYILAGAFTSGYHDSVKCLTIAKKNNPKVISILGGVHASFCYKEVFKDYSNSVDYVVIGEGEITAVELINAIECKGTLSNIPGIVYKENNSLIENPVRELITNLDTLIPAWDILNWDSYEFFVIPKSRMAPLSTSRGCINSCAFCSQKDFWKGSYRERSAGSVLAEIKLLYEKYKINIFFLTDEYPTYNRARWIEILDGILKMKLDALFLMETTVKDIIRDGDIISKYRKAGFVHIYIGVESGDQEQLERFNKKITVEESKEAIRIINQAGIVSECSFILGHPDESQESINKTLELAFYYEPYFPHFIQYAPWPYNGMNDHLKEYIEVTDYSKYNFTEPIMRSKYLTRDELRQCAVECYRKFYEKRGKEYMLIEDLFLRNYLLKTVDLMMKNSFLAKHNLHKKMNPVGDLPRTGPESGG